MVITQDLITATVMGTGIIIRARATIPTTGTTPATTGTGAMAAVTGARQA